MAVIIGEDPGSDFSNPIGVLTDCHRRIEKFLNVLHTVTRNGGGAPLDDDHRQALEIALRYFRESAPKHTADEEESLFPRMWIRAASRSPSITDVVEILNTDHKSLSATHEEVDHLGHLWLADDFLKPRETSQLVTIIQNLKDVYERHIAIEEHDIFPIAGRILTQEDLQAIAKEMAARRNLKI